MKKEQCYTCDLLSKESMEEYSKLLFIYPFCVNCGEYKSAAVMMGMKILLELEENSSFRAILVNM